MKKIIMTFLFLPFLILSSSFLFADNMASDFGDIEFVLMQESIEVSTGSRVEMSLEETPGSMTVLTKKAINLYGLENLIDVFNLIPGFQVYMSEHNEWVVTARGYVSGFAPIKLMIDGHPVNEAIWHGNMAWADYPLDDVEQIEVMRGPGSALYGTNAFSGVINIITKKEKRTEAAGVLGEFEHKRGHFTYFGDPSKDIYCSFIFDYMEEQGDDLMYDRDYLSMTPLTKAPRTKQREKKRMGASASLHYKNLDLVVNHSDTEQMWIEGVGNILTEEGMMNPMEYTYLDIQYEHELSDESLLTFKGGYDINKNTFEGFWLPKGFTFGADINADGVVDSWPNGAVTSVNATGTSFDMEAIWTKKLEKHDLIVGIQYGVDEIKEVNTVANFHPRYMFKLPDNTKLTANTDQWITGEGESETLLAGYVQDIYKPSSIWTIVAGARYDDYSIAGGTLSPRAALIWNASEDCISELSYGRAFFAPSVMRRYANVRGWIGNPDLESQTIDTIELSLQNPYEKDFHYAAAVYYSKVKDFIVLDINSVPSYANRGDADFTGLELDGRWNITKRFGLWGNYSYVDAKDDSLDADFQDSVQHMGNFGFFSEIWDKLFFSAFSHISGEQARLGSVPGANEKLDGWYTINSTVVYKGIKNTEISLIAKNLFDTDYAYPNNTITMIGTGTGSDYPANGRQVLLKAKVGF